MPLELFWLPSRESWRKELQELQKPETAVRWEELVRLANSRIDFVQTNQLDRLLTKRKDKAAHAGVPTIRLAVLASATVHHLIPAIRVGALRRGLRCEVYEAEYGQYLQELSDPESGLAQFQPTAILFALDSHHLAEADVRTASPEVADHSLALLQRCWTLAKERFHCAVLQTTLLPVFPPLMGSNEARLPFSPANTVAQINRRLRESADAFGVHLVALDEHAMADGIHAWYNPALWHRAKQEIDPRAAPLLGDVVGRVLAAERGRSAKCLVLDLDNTLWGGVIGDDGVGGISLGQGTGVGEAFVSFQRYLLRLSQRGVILAVCSKNDEVNALLPFESHPEMVLRRSDIACFTANWQDKASNLRAIAKTLNIGLDALVFADDNPFERDQVRTELPAVAVPELPDDPSYYETVLAAGGYFEALSVTAEDSERGRQYQANAEREKIREQASDMDSYLASLGMKLIAGPVNSVNLKRVAQLINKTNQFNLTTRRYGEAEVELMMNAPGYVSLQMRLLDRFGDNGIISVVIGKQAGQVMVLDTWLMSCRVLGRQVEEAALNLVAAAARERGAAELTGEYRPTEKNGMVKDFYARLGFDPVVISDDGSSTWRLDLRSFAKRAHRIEVIEEAYAAS